MVLPISVYRAFINEDGADIGYQNIQDDNTMSPAVSQEA